MHLNKLIEKMTRVGLDSVKEKKLKPIEFCTQMANFVGKFDIDYDDIFRYIFDYFKEHPEEIPKKYTSLKMYGYEEGVDISIDYDSKDIMRPSDFDKANTFIEDDWTDIIEIYKTNKPNIVFIKADDIFGDGFTTLEDLKNYFSDEDNFNYAAYYTTRDMFNESLEEPMINEKMVKVGQQSEQPIKKSEVSASAKPLVQKATSSLQKIAPLSANFKEMSKAIDKMDAWHNGERRENYKAASDAKLVLYYNICKRNGYDEQANLLKAEMNSRGITESLAEAMTHYNNEYNLTKEEVQFILDRMEAELGWGVDWKNDDPQGDRVYGKHHGELMKSIMQKLSKVPTNESLTEAKNETLNPAIWDGDELKPEVKDKLELIANKFIDKLKEEEIPLDVKDIIIVGSNANYNYTQYSDIDLHIVADLSEFKGREKELVEKLYQAKKSIFNSKYDPIINGFNVEIYVEPAEDRNMNEIPDEIEDKVEVTDLETANESLNENMPNTICYLLKFDIKEEEVEFDEPFDLQDDFKELYYEVRSKLENIIETKINNLGFVKVHNFDYDNTYSCFLDADHQLSDTELKKIISVVSDCYVEDDGYTTVYTGHGDNAEEDSVGYYICLTIDNVAIQPYVEEALKTDYTINEKMAFKQHFTGDEDFEVKDAEVIYTGGGISVAYGVYTNGLGFSLGSWDLYIYDEDARYMFDSNDEARWQEEHNAVKNEDFTGFGDDSNLFKSTLKQVFEKELQNNPDASSKDIADDADIFYENEELISDFLNGQWSGKAKARIESLDEKMAKVNYENIFDCYLNWVDDDGSAYGYCDELEKAPYNFYHGEVMFEDEKSRAIVKSIGAKRGDTIRIGIHKAPEGKYDLGDMYEVDIIGKVNEALTEDTVKQGSKWVNKGKEGTHGKFKTKKAADNQRKAMYANGYKGESLEEGYYRVIIKEYDGEEHPEVFTEFENRRDLEDYLNNNEYIEYWDYDNEIPDFNEDFDFPDEVDATTYECPDCQEHLTFAGYHGDTEEYKCPVCGKYFYLEDGELLSSDGYDTKHFGIYEDYFEGNDIDDFQLIDKLEKLINTFPNACPEVEDFMNQFKTLTNELGSTQAALEEMDISTYDLQDFVDSYNNFRN